MELTGNAKRHLANGTVYRSRVKQKAYRVAEVADQKIVIKRLDANKTESVTKSNLETALARIIRAGGTVARGKLHSQVAVEVSLVELLGCLRWSHGSDIIEYGG